MVIISVNNLERFKVCRRHHRLPSCLVVVRRAVRCRRLSSVPIEFPRMYISYIITVTAFLLVTYVST
jgi:hypothetical protein